MQLSELKQLTVRDWARMYYDIECVKNRILVGRLPIKWRNLSEQRKEELAQEVANTVERIQQQGSNASDEKHICEHWHKIVDLAKYGIFLDES